MSKQKWIDEQLIILLGQDALQSREKLAKQLNVSTTTIRRRLNKLIQSNQVHIIGVVDPAKFGLPVAAVFGINVQYDKLESAQQALVDCPEIRWVATSSGRFDIVAIGRFSSTNHLYDFLAKQLPRIEGFRVSETSICFTVKKGPLVSLTAADLEVRSNTLP